MKTSPRSPRRSGPARTLLALVGVAMLAGSVGTALAQDGQPDPPQIRPPTEKHSPLLIYGVVIVLGGALIGVNLLPSKRGHQD